MRNTYLFIKLIIINLAVIGLGASLFYVIVKHMDQLDDTKFSILVGGLGTPIVGLVSYELKLIYDYMKHKDKLDKGDKND